MNKYKKILESILMAGMVCGFTTFVLNFITVSYWQRDGFDFLEIALMTIVAGLFLFILKEMEKHYLVLKSLQDCLLDSKMPF